MTASQAPLSDANWTVLYDVSQSEPSGVIFPLIGLVLVAAAIVAVRQKHFTRDGRGETVVIRGSRSARRFLWFSVALLILTVVFVLGEHVRLVWALREKKYVVVEGTVEDFIKAHTLRRNRPERWRVGSHRYQFFHYQSHSGLSTPGLVEPGMYVRIADVNGVIARLEVAR